MPTAVPFPSPLQPDSQAVAMKKEAYDPVSNRPSVVGTSAPSKLKRHKRYYMSEGNIVIQVCSTTSRHIILS